MEEEASGHNSPLQKYLAEIGQSPLLTRDEELELGRQSREGSLEARRKLIECNLRLVVYVAKKHNSGAYYENLFDLIQEGNCGLITAATRYNPEYKTRFSTYAMWWIRQAIFRYIKSDRLIRLPENVIDKMLQTQRVKEILNNEIGHEPELADIAAYMDTTLAEVEALEQHMLRIASLEFILEDEDGSRGEMGEVINREEESLEERVGRMLDFDLLEQLVKTLPDRERAVLEQRFGLHGCSPMTLDRLGKSFALSRERIRQIELAAIKRLRNRPEFSIVSGDERQETRPKRPIKVDKAKDRAARRSTRLVAAIAY